MNASQFRTPGAIIPIAMSIGAILTVLYQVVFHGIAAQPDEGALAHIWQILMAGQVPIVAFYAIKWMPQVPKAALQVLAVQIGAALAALAPVYLLGW